MSADSTPPARLAAATYLEHLARDSDRFREVLAATEPGTRVPGCPEWDADDLLWHLASVQWFWSQVVARRPAGPEELTEPERPSGRVALLDLFDEATAALRTGLAAASPDEPAWSWSEDQTVGFTVRRQAHEALVHRLDAEQAAGAETPMDPALAADGVVEVLDVMYGAAPPFGSWSPRDAWVRVDLTDTGHRCWVQVGWFTGTSPGGEVLDGDDIRVVGDPGRDPHVVVSGTAADVDAWLWQRRDREVVSIEGDETVWERFLGAVSHPID